MSLAETIHFDKAGEPIRSPLFRKVFLALVIILTAALSFGIGRLSVGGDRGGVTIELDPALNQVETGAISIPSQTATTLNATRTSSATEVVVSKNGERYHYAHCAGAKQIKEENKVFFSTPEAAEAAGFSLAANCRPR